MSKTSILHHAASKDAVKLTFAKAVAPLFSFFFQPYVQGLPSPSTQLSLGSAETGKLDDARCGALGVLFHEGGDDWRTKESPPFFPPR